MCNRGYAWLPPPPSPARPAQKYNMYYRLSFARRGKPSHTPPRCSGTPLPGTAIATATDRLGSARRGGVAEWRSGGVAERRSGEVGGGGGKPGGGGSLHGTNTLAPVRKCVFTCTRCKQPRMQRVRKRIRYAGMRSRVKEGGPRRQVRANRGPPRAISLGVSLSPFISHSSSISSLPPSCLPPPPPPLVVATPSHRRAVPRRRAEPRC